MYRGKELAKFVGAFVALLTIVLVIFAAAPPAVNAVEEADEAAAYVIKAKAEAESARADAERAMAKAERAIAEADRAIAEAERAKREAKGEKAKAIEKMVRAHQYPDDISMTSPDPGEKTIAIFSHKKHTDREKLSCMECHPKVFIMKVGKNVVKKGHLSMEEMQKGKYCGNCHNGHKAFSVTDISSCKKCHPKSK